MVEGLYSFLIAPRAVEDGAVPGGRVPPCVGVGDLVVRSLFFRSSLELLVRLGQDWGWELEDSDVVVGVGMGVVSVRSCTGLGGGRVGS